MPELQKLSIDDKEVQYDVVKELYNKQVKFTTIYSLMNISEQELIDIFLKIECEGYEYLDLYKNLKKRVFNEYYQTGCLNDRFFWLKVNSFIDGYVDGYKIGSCETALRMLSADMDMNKIAVILTMPVENVEFLKNHIMLYKDYFLKYSYDENSDFYSGSILGIDNEMNVKSDTKEGLEKEFQSTIDRHLEECEINGNMPMKCDVISYKLTKNNSVYQQWKKMLEQKGKEKKLNN